MSAQKVVLITAGTAGLGAQIAQTHKKIQVINYANNADRAKSLLSELDAIPSTSQSTATPRFHAIKADVGLKPSVQSLVKETVDTMGRLDVVISNAGW
ncbi:hypothetical protein LTS18_001297 [Coniosporium uncinatum]|uniref:Uncharacterized protein n=1 Tax=Coniosporium uncinatum TaxID=93489 RepID=A0ACC3CTK1_9PEZI|nr:hypothetical protein LTS18_001297 [Coniosporium uncinatum]